MGPTGTDGICVTALVTGLVPLVGVLGLGFGIVGLRRVGRSGRGGKGLAIAGIVLGSIWLLIVLLAALGAATDAHHAGATGTLTATAPGAGNATGTVTFRDLEVGNCVTGSLQGTSIKTVQLTPCAGPHSAEVFLTYSMTGEKYPGASAVKASVLARCRHYLPGFVNAPRGHTGYYINYLFPTASTWAYDDKEVTCLLGDPAHQPITGEARGAGAFHR